MNTVDSLPKRRGVVMRADGISDSYGVQYVRVNGGLRRVTPKAQRRPRVLAGVEL